MQEQGILEKKFSGNIETIKLICEERHKIIYTPKWFHEDHLEIDKNHLIISTRIKNEFYILDIKRKEIKAFNTLGKIQSIAQESEKLLIGTDISLELFTINGVRLNILESDKQLLSVHLNKDATLAIVGDNTGLISIWDLENQLKIKSIQLDDHMSYLIALFKDDQKFVSLENNRNIKIWSMDPRIDSLQSLMHTYMITDSSKILKVADDYIISDREYWKWNNYSSKINITGLLFGNTPISRINIAAISYNYEYLAYYDSRKNLKIYELTTSTELINITPEKPVKSLCFSRDNIKLYYSTNEQIHEMILREDLLTKKLCTLEETPVSLCNYESTIYISSPASISKYNKKDKMISKINNDNFMNILYPLSSSNQENNKEIESCQLITGEFNIIQHINHDKLEGNTIHLPNDILFLYCNSLNLLTYDSYELRIYDRLFQNRYSMELANICSAILSCDSMYIISHNIELNEIYIHDMQNREDAKVILKNVKQIVAYCYSLYFIAITHSSILYIYDIPAKTKTVKFSLPNKEFTGQAIIYEDLYLFTSYTDEIRITSLQDYTYIGSIPIIGLTTFCLSYTQEEIFYCANKDLFSIINPVNMVNEYNPTLVNFNKITFNIWNDIKETISTETILKTLPNDFIIMPFCITPILIFSNINNALLMKQAMRNNYKYLSYNDKQLNPITLAIIRKNREIINCLMKEIVYASNNDPTIFLRIEDDIVELNLNGSTPNLELFYRGAFKVNTHLPKFSHLLNKSFVAKQSYSEDMHRGDFISDNPDVEILSYHTSKIRLNIEIFSQNSIEFLESIINCNNTNIFTTPFIQAILLYKWRLIKKLVYLQFALYLTYLAIFTIYVGFQLKNPTKIETDKMIMLPIMLVFNTIFLLAEIPLFSLNILNYITDIWNLLDSVRIILFYAYSIMFFSETGIEYNQQQLTLGTIILLSWLRALAFFRIFRRTRYLVRIILQVNKDIFTFTLILIYCITCSAILGHNIEDEDIWSEFKTQYLIAFGQFSTDGYDTVKWVQFYFSTIISLLVMMTMLISLMVSSYSRIKENSTVADYIEMASYILEIESIFLRSGKKGEKKFFQFCYSKKDLQLSIKEESIDEKLKIMKKKILTFEGCFNIYEKDFKENKNKCLQELQEIIKEVSDKSHDIYLINEELNKEIDQKSSIVFN